MATQYIARLEKLIRDLYGCESTHIDTVRVRETVRGKIVWDGAVETFLLSGHSEAKVAYA
jgi:hypothetical protein